MPDRDYITLARCFRQGYPLSREELDRLRDHAERHGNWLLAQRVRCADSRVVDLASRRRGA